MAAPSFAVGDKVTVYKKGASDPNVWYLKGTVASIDGDSAVLRPVNILFSDGTVHDFIAGIEIGIDDFTIVKDQMVGGGRRRTRGHRRRLRNKSRRDARRH